MSAADPPLSDGAFERRLESGVIARRRLIGEIARGRTSVVSLAAIGGPGVYTVFVTKELQPPLRGDDAAVSAFREAGRIARRLDHPNLVRTLDVRDPEAADPYLLAMEFVDGQPYERVVRRANRLGPALPLRIHLRVLVAVLSALEHIHAQPGPAGAPGLLHLGVTPQNVFITYDGRVKLLGPGPEPSGGRAGQGDVASRGPSYRAPECVNGRVADRRADVFAVGVMLHEAMLSSQRTAGGGPPGADPALVAIARRAMQGDPGARYPTATAMREVLELYASRSRLSLPDARDVGSSLSSLFATERQKQQAAIKARLAALDSGDADDGDLPTRIVLTPSAPLVSSVRPPAPPRAIASSEAPPVMAPSVPPAAPWPAPGPGMGYRMVASLVGVLAMAGVTWLLLARPHEAPAGEVASGTVARVGAPLGPDLGVPLQKAPVVAPPPVEPVVAAPVVAAVPLVRARPVPSAATRAAPRVSPKVAPEPPPAPASVPPEPAPAPAPVAAPAVRAPASADSPIAAPPPRPERAIHKDNPYLP